MIQKKIPKFRQILAILNKFVLFCSNCSLITANIIAQTNF